MSNSFTTHSQTISSPRLTHQFSKQPCYAATTWRLIRCCQAAHQIMGTDPIFLHLCFPFPNPWFYCLEYHNPTFNNAIFLQSNTSNWTQGSL